MRFPKITPAFLIRIGETKEWLDNGPSPIEGLRIRKGPCKAIPLKWLDDPKRKERHGVRFRLVFAKNDSSADYFFADIDVRINPKDDGSELHEGAWVVIYAVNSTGTEDAIT